MPVARIVTRFAEEAAPLIGRLRARGYTIEVVDPGTFRVTPADLEIALDRMQTPEALAGAVRFARECDAEVFVAAGLSLDEEAARALRGVAVRRSVLAEGLKKLIAPFRRLGAEAHADRAARRQRVLAREMARETEKKQRAEEKAAQAAERARLQQEAAERDRLAHEAARARQQQEQEARLVRLREEEERGRVEHEGALARQREQEVRQREEAARRGEEAARLAAERKAQLAERRREEETAQQKRAAQAARLVAEEQERRRVAAELAQAERERQREESERRRLAGAAALVEAKRRDAQALQRAPAARREERPRPAAAVPPEPAGNRIMKRAFAAAASLAVLMALGWGAYQNRMPAAPLSNQQRVRGAEIQQDVPFGAATIKPKRAAQKPPAAPQKTQAKPAPAGAPKPSPVKRTRRYAADDVDMVAEDEIVYHGAPKNSKSRASAQAQQQQQDGVKRISDLDDE
jgi:hypothetical protein